jgi:hypothetical protein
MFPPVSQDDYSMTLTEAAAYIGSLTGHRPPSATMHRWAQRGVGGIRLSVHKIGGRYYTGRLAVEAFLEATDMPVRRQPRPVAVVTTGLHGRMDDRRATLNAVRPSPTHDASIQYLRSKLNLMGFLMVC